jgi:hypothetical protein
MRMVHPDPVYVVIRFCSCSRVGGAETGKQPLLTGTGCINVRKPDRNPQWHSTIASIVGDSVAFEIKPVALDIQILKAGLNDSIFCDPAALSLFEIQLSSR